MNEHASNLRRTRADMLGTDDDEHYGHCHDAATEIERLSSEGERMRKALERIECALTGVTAVGPDGALQIAKSTLARVSEEQPPDTCPECHGTGKTVINKHIGVEDCPECSRDSEGLAPKEKL